MSSVHFRSLARGGAGRPRAPAEFPRNFLVPIPDVLTTIAAVLPEVAAVSAPPPLVLAEILAVASEVGPRPLGRLRVAVLDVLLDFLPVSGDVAPLSSDIPSIAPDVAPILPDVPRVLLDTLCARGGRAQGHRQRASRQQRDQSPPHALLR